MLTLFISSSPASGSSLKNNDNTPLSDRGSGPPAIAKIQGKEFEYLVRQDRVVIGRHSSTRGEADINMGHSSFISRKHIGKKSDEIVLHVYSGKMMLLSICFLSYLLSDHSLISNISDNCNVL